MGEGEGVKVLVGEEKGRGKEKKRKKRRMENKKKRWIVKSISQDEKHDMEMTTKKINFDYFLE